MSEEGLRLWREKVEPKLTSRVSATVLRMLGYAYYAGWLNKPIEKVTDAEFLSIQGIGPVTLAEIRRVIPSSASGRT